jgi:hypothetical protein
VVERGYEGLVAKDEASVYEGGLDRRPGRRGRPHALTALSGDSIAAEGRDHLQCHPDRDAPIVRQRWVPGR